MDAHLIIVKDYKKSSMKVYLFYLFDMCDTEFPAGDSVVQQIMKETAMLNLSIFK